MPINFTPTPIPQGQVQTGERKPIGVSADYKPHYEGQTQDPKQTKVRYWSGSEYDSVAGLSPEDRADLQLTLRDLGLIGPKTKIRLGLWDSTSASAFRQVLAWANTRGIGWRAALAEMQQSSSLGDLGGEGEAAPLPTNSLDIQAAARDTSRSVLGRGLTDAEKSRVEGAYHSMEAPYLQGTASQDAPGSAGAQEFLRQQVRAVDPVRADSRSAVKVAGVIAKMLGGGTSFGGDL